ITTASGKVPPPVFNIVHYKLRITTVSVYLCVQILSAFPLWSISGSSSGIVIGSVLMFMLELVGIWHISSFKSLVMTLSRVSSLGGKELSAAMNVKNDSGRLSECQDDVL